MGSNSPSYSLPPQKVTFKGLLFDMDGTIIDSTSAVEKLWHKIGNELGVDPEVILQTSHGRRSMDVLKLLCPEKANWDYIKQMEGLLPRLYGDEAVEIPGARALLESLTHVGAKWAIVTSGTTPLVSGWLSVLALPRPEHLVVAEDVDNGKPDPSCYLMGKEKLGLLGRRKGAATSTPAAQGEGEGQDDVLVLEDSPAGIRAGKAAGCRVLGVVTSHTMQQVVDAGADWIVRDLRSVRLLAGSSGSGSGGGGAVTLEILDALDLSTA